jgi:hypothetical protein
MYRRIQSIWVICCFLFLLAYDTHGLQLVTRDVYEAEIFFFYLRSYSVLIVWVKI